MSKKHIQIDNSSFFEIPSLPRIQNTLLFIQTIKSFNNNHSFTSLDAANEQPSCENSLGVSLAIQVQAQKKQASSRKKKGGCTCKKTNCLKMYCQCFSSGKVCTPQCACYGCYNQHGNEQILSEVKQKAKPKKFTKGQGCNCKKTQCQKKYCQCFNAGLKCGQNCKCTACENCQDKQDRQCSHRQINFSQFID